MGRRPVPDRRATYDAAPNIALVKYWGMRDVDRGLPYNSSLSVTLDRLRTRTSVRFDPTLDGDRFELNGVGVDGPPRTAVSRFLDRVRTIAGFESPAEVASTNNFQTASGLASSASGFAALAGAATNAAGLELSPRALSALARLGSGSASRSIFGGFVEWRAGVRPDGRDCYARPLFAADHWPALTDVVALIAAAPEKATRSADAMQSSVRTSPLFRRRQVSVPPRLARMRRAIRDRDAPTLFRLVIEECDEFRAVCESTDPPLDYLTPASREVLAAVDAMNAAAGRALVGYTHDAGAHVHLFTLAADASRLRERLARIRGVAQVLTLHPGAGARLVRVGR